MIEKFEITTHAGEIALYKTHLQWRRRRHVRLKAGFTSHTYDFAANENMVRFNGLTDGENCWLTVRNGSPLKKYLSRPWKTETSACDRQLRVLVTGSGRCGTHSTANFLNGLRFLDGEPAQARHETLHEHIMPAIISEDLNSIRYMSSGFRHEIESAPYFALASDGVEANVVVHLIRDGRRVVQSGLNRGWYQSDSLWNRIKPDFPGNLFEKCCHFWAHTNRNAAGIADLTYRLEDLSSSPQAVAGLLNDLEIQPSERPFPVDNQGKQSSSFTDWSAEQHETFVNICGDLMDSYYPRWQR